jgi:hypothetical protein
VVEHGGWADDAMEGGSGDVELEVGGCHDVMVVITGDRRWLRGGSGGPTAVRRGDGDAALTVCDGAGGAADTRGGRGGDGSQRRTVLYACLIFSDL